MSERYKKTDIGSDESVESVYALWIGLNASEKLYFTVRIYDFVAAFINSDRKALVF
jgi:hypothetical protein